MKRRRRAVLAAPGGATEAAARSEQTAGPGQLAANGQVHQLRVDDSWSSKPSSSSVVDGSLERNGVRAAEAEVVHDHGDDAGEASGPFNLGVWLHQRGDVAGAMAAYERAEQRGDLDAAFNLGVLLYETGDLDGAEAAWRRAVLRGHRRAAANLGFLMQRPDDLEGADSESTLADPSPAGVSRSVEAEGPEFAIGEEANVAYRRAGAAGNPSDAFDLGVRLHAQGDLPGAVAAYQQAERSGDLDAAFNLGVLLYETGDLDGAEAAWRRAVLRGHRRAAANLSFLMQRRRDLAEAAIGSTEGGGRAD